MAALLKLHCEESYILNEQCPTEQVVRSESARRVFWMIQSQENLHSGYKTPAPFPLDDITTLLPCSEADFAFGIIPSERAALAGTPPGLANPQLVHSPDRCLFATLIQAHGLWGTVARRAGRTGYGINKIPPWDDASEHQKTIMELQNWEQSIPARHTFSVWNLRGWKSESLHLAYLSVTMVLRLSNIVTRRIYLENMLSALTHKPPDQPQGVSPQTGMASCDQSSPAYHPSEATLDAFPSSVPEGFWEKTSRELFINVWKLYEQIDAFFTMRAPDEGFPQILVFCVYISGSLASYLWRYPALCPSLADKAKMMAQRSLEVLGELHAAWPTSSKWQKGLQQIATPLAEVSPGDQQEETTSTSQEAERMQGSLEDAGQQSSSSNEQANDMQRAPASKDQSPVLSEGMLEELMNMFPIDNSYMPRLGSAQVGTLSNELFDAELDAFLQGGFHYDLLGGWGKPSFGG
ncbi:hypothetical protein QQX98_009193 [Neonectria punicea]|uniref:Transcription factor domain-containing protein n=1 Tax=Neonectria punicea TaxID=979145 RepID=A0ABR1GTA2_9HYPO